MNARLSVLVLFLGLGSAFACGGTDPAPAQKADGGTGGGTGSGGSGTGGGAPTADAAWDGGIVDINGHWQGTWTSGRGPSGMLSADVTSSDPTILGTITLGGTACFTRALSFTGTSIDLHILLFATQPEGDLRIAADVSPSVDAITGTYTISNGACDGDNGTLAMNR